MDRVDEQPENDVIERSPSPSRLHGESSSIADSVFDVATYLVDARASLLYIVDPGTSELHLVTSRGLRAGLSRGFERIALESSTPAARAFVTARPQVTGLSAAELGIPRLANLLKATGARTYVAVPLVTDSGAAIGVLGVAVGGGRGQKEAKTIEMVSALAVGLTSAQGLERERRRREQLDAVRSAAIRIAGASDVTEALQIVVDVAHSLTSAGKAAIGLVDENDPCGPFRLWVHKGVAETVAAAIQRKPRPVGLLGVVLREGRSVRSRDIHRDPRFRGLPEDHPGIQSFVGVPILSSGKTVGGLFAADKSSAREFDADDEEVLVLLAEHAGVALRLLGDLSRLEERAAAGERAQRHLAAHYSAARALAEASSFDDAAERILRALCYALGWSWGCLWIVDAANGVLRCGQATTHSSSGGAGSFAEITRRWTFPRGVGVPGRVWESGEPLWVRDVVDEPRFLRLGSAAKTGMHGAFFIPIPTRSGIVGVIEVMSTRAEPPDDELLALLAGFGAQLGELIERKRIEEEREKLLEELAAERSWLRAVIERSPVAILFVSENPERLLVNRRVEELFGQMTSRADLDALEERLHRVEGERLESADLPWVRALAGDVVNAEELCCRSDGEVDLALLVSAVPITDVYGRQIGAVVLLEDISSFRELAKLREEWTAMVAHDLRQPVAAITMAASHLSDGQRTGEFRACAERIRKSADRLNRMISDLLDASRLDARRLTLNLERVDTAQFLAAAIEQARSALAASVSLHVAGALPPLSIDPARIEQVLANLLSNAIKYGNPGSPIDVEARVCGDEVWISVTNQGPGIARVDIERIFERFERLERRGGRGVGLGLYIARGLVEAHGGRIWVESELGHTTSFRFALPIPHLERARPDTAPPSTEASPSNASV